MPQSILSKILFALKILTLEYEGDGHLKVIGQPPAWSGDEFDCVAADIPRFHVNEFSLFLENFLVDAEEFWVGHPDSFLRSGLWSETGQSGQDIRLEAVALFLEGRRILLIESSDSKYSERFRWLQTARQERLNFISERKIAETKIIGAKFYDTLTGLPNQTFFLSQLTERFDQLRQHSQDFAVLVLNLDRFQLLNDSLGHGLGDQLLRAVAERLKGCLRPNDIPVRFGSDEFGILLHRVESQADALAIAQRVNEQLKRGFRFWDLKNSLAQALAPQAAPQEQEKRQELERDQMLMITASMGIAISERERYSTPRELLRNASIAMHQAKSLDRGSSVLFERRMHARAFELWSLETDLHRALQEGELQVWYQPLVSLKSHRIVSFESLIRWYHPTRGWISPSEFVPLAEDSGFILEIDYWVLQQACEQLRIWRSQGHHALSINVNLSCRHFGEADLLARIETILRETQVDPAWLNLEITESLLLTDWGTTLAQLQQLRQLGVQLSIDDFGTGYASFSYLQDLPVQKLKIDGYFIDTMLENGTHIVSTIIELAHRLQLQVTAERVETEEQYRKLAELGCDQAQGYWMAKPMSVEGAIALLGQSFMPGRLPSSPQTISEGTKEGTIF